MTDEQKISEWLKTNSVRRIAPSVRLYNETQMWSLVRGESPETMIDSPEAMIDSRRQIWARIADEEIEVRTR